jgi:hypothetical protein
MNIILLPSTVEAISKHCRFSFTMTMHWYKVELRADVKQVRAIAAIAAAVWDPAALRTEQQNDRRRAYSTRSGNRTTGVEIHRRTHPYLQKLLGSVEILAVRNGILERSWGFANGRSQIAQVVLPRSKVRYVLTELHGGSSGGHLCINKTLNKVLLSLGNKRYWKMVRNPCSQSRPADQESEPNMPIQCWSSLPKDSH